MRDVRDLRPGTEFERMRQALRGVVVVSLAGALLVGGCSVGDGDRPAGATTTASTTAGSGHPRQAATGPLAKFYNQRLSWSDCHGGFQCARLEVPIDYAAPEGDTIKLSVVRKRASGSSPRGSLVINPGGPGASGVDYALAADIVISDAVRRRYHVVGFDPRGVRRSAPIQCVSDARLDRLLAIDGSPDDAAEEQQIADEWAALGAGCAKRRPQLTAHIGTQDAARDLDVLRAALGDRRLSYLGKSYGTFLGATYAELFPRRVGRLVLDGMLDPAASGPQIAAGQAAGFQRAFRAYLKSCLSRSSCPFRGPVDAAQARVARLLTRLDSTPLPAEPGRPVTEALAVIGVAAALYDEGSWSLLTRAFREALRGRGDTLLALADYYSDRGPNGHYTTNSIEALYAVSCLDRPESKDLADYRAAAAAVSKSSPVFGPFIAWGSVACATWPVPPTGEPHPIVAAGANPILVVGTTRDPATPYSWAVSAARAFASARLLTYDGDGHTAYRRGSACIDRAVDRFLLEGRLPSKGTRCR